jgi:hypothetical protein
MKTLLTAATVAAALLTGAPVKADNIYADAALLATIESIDVIVEDDVVDRCLFNAKGIEARLSVTLERSGIPVSDASPWTLYAYFLGGPTRNGDRRDGCMISTDLQLVRPGPNNTRIVAGGGSAINIGPNAQDDAAMRKAEEFADEVIAAILAARRSAGTAGVSGRQS